MASIFKDDFLVNLNLLSSVLISSSHAIQIITPDKKTSFANASWCRLFDVDPRVALGMDWMALKSRVLNPFDLEKAWDLCIEDGQSQGRIRIKIAQQITKTLTFYCNLCADPTSDRKALLNIYTEEIVYATQKEAPFTSALRLIRESQEKIAAVQLMLELLPKREFEPEIVMNELIEIRKLIDSGLNNHAGIMEKDSNGKLYQIREYQSHEIRRRWW